MSYLGKKALCGTVVYGDISDRPLNVRRKRVTTKEFLDRERLLARRFGVRKTDVYYQLVRCPSCGHEALLRNRFTREAHDSISSVENAMLGQLRRDVRASCTKCGHQPLRGDGSRHVYLLYTERQDAHVAVTLRLEREEDGRVRVRRQAWFVDVDGKAEELEDAEDPRLLDVWLDASIRRWALETDPTRAAEGLANLASEHGGDALVLRELGFALLDAGQNAPAARALSASLDADGDQVRVLRRLGRLHVREGRPAEAAELLVRAFDLSASSDLLPEVIHACYRGQRVGALAAAAEALLELETDHLVGLKARVCVEDASNIGAWRDAWEDLARAAELAGERYTERVASAWVQALTLPLPDWEAGVRPEAYREILADECLAMSFEVEREPDPLNWGDATLPVDLEVIDDEGITWLVWLCAHEATAATDQTLAAAARAAMEDPRRSACRLLPLSRSPLSYAVCRWASSMPDATVDLEADADTTMAVSDENVTSFMQLVEATFGRTLDLSLSSLDEVDEVLRRYHDDGFGTMTYALRCQAASYVGAVIRRILGHGAWNRSPEDDGDPYLFELANGARVQLVRRISRAVDVGDDDGLKSFVRVVLRSAGVEVVP